MTKAPRKLAYLVFPFGLAIASIGAFLALMHFHLRQTAELLVHEFERSSSVDIARADTSTLAVRLNSLSGQVHWVCIRGFRNGVPFLERTNGSCDAGLLRNVVKIGRPNQELEIVLTATLPAEWFFVGFVFLALQLLILVMFGLSFRRAERSRLEGAEQLGQVAVQLAHDMRSPLAALKVGAEGLAKQGESTQLITAAAARLTCIADDILCRYRKSSKMFLKQPTEASGKKGHRTGDDVTAGELINQVVTEKNAHVLLGIDAKIKLSANDNALSALLMISRGEFQRVLSNIIDNSIDAIREPGLIEINFSVSSGVATLEVRDNGHGIPPKTLDAILAHGLSFGKVGGNGLGLSHARRTIERAGGNFRISSPSTGGTSVVMTIPCLVDN